MGEDKVTRDKYDKIFGKTMIVIYTVFEGTRMRTNKEKQGLVGMVDVNVWAGP